MGRRLSAIADWINANRPELRATVEKSSSSTDTKVAGTRFIRRGRGRKGNRIKIYLREGGPVDGIGAPKPIFDHNAAETYRSNDEVECWLSDYLRCKEKGEHRVLFKSDTACRTCGGTIK